MNTKKIRKRIRREYSDRLGENNYKIGQFRENIENVKSKIAFIMGFEIAENPLVKSRSMGDLIISQNHKNYEVNQVFEIRFNEDFTHAIPELELNELDAISLELNWIKTVLGLEDMGTIDIAGPDWDKDESCLNISFFITEGGLDDTQDEKVIIGREELEGLKEKLANMEYAISEMKREINGMY